MTGGRVRVLVTDNNDKLRALLRRALEREGYAVFEAGTAAELWSALVAFAPDILLLDVALPDNSGWGLLQKLKADPASASIPVLLWSGRYTPQERPVAIELGAEDYLEKGPPSRVVPTIRKVSRDVRQRH